MHILNAFEQIQHENSNDICDWHQSLNVDFECSCFPYSSSFIGGNGIEILHVEKFTVQVIKILQARNGRINRPVVTCNPLSSFAREHRAGIAAYAA